MKRFSKIFCVALVVIVFACSISQNWLSINIASADATHKAAIMKLCKDGTNTNVAKGPLNLSKSTADISSISGATIDDFQGTCYSNSINFISGFLLRIYNADTSLPSTTFDTKTKVFFSTTPGGDIDTSLMQIIKNSTPASGSYYYAAKVYETLRQAIPDNADFPNNASIKTMNEWLSSGGPEDVSIVKSGDRSEAAPWAPSPVPADTNTDCADITPGFLSCLWDLPLCFLKYANIGIIHLTSWVIKVGVNTMGWLMQPHNLWGGISNNPAVVQAFGASVSVVNIVFSIVLIVMAIGTILNIKNYRINDLITKFIIVALLVNFTLVIAGSVLDLANYISLYFFNATLKSVQSGDVVTKWTEILTSNVCLSGWASSVGRMLASVVINLLVFIAIGTAMLLMCGSLLKRGLLLMFLLILSPFAVICYLLPAKGLGQWWDKWKKEFLKQAFYGVYISVGFYLGTIMLSALAINPTQSADPDLSFIASLIKPILAAGYLVYIVILADQVAGGSAKSTVEGVTKFALGAATGGVTAAAMKAKTAITTSENYGKSVGALSIKKGLGWVGKAGLKVRENDLAYINKKGEAVDEEVNSRDIDTNKARLKAIATSTDPKLAREKVAIAKQLIAQKKMDKVSAKLLEDNIGTIANDNNRRTGWISPALQKSLKDSMPSLFIRYDVEKNTGTSEEGVTNAMNQHLDANDNVDIEATAQALVNAHPDLKLKQEEVAKALRKYLDDRAKIGIQFGRIAANANEEALVESLIDNNAAVQEEIVRRMAENPATIRSVMDQISESGLSREKKEQITNLFQNYIDKHGDEYSEKQLDYIDENVSRLNTANARTLAGLAKHRVSSPSKAYDQAVAEDAARTAEKQEIELLDKEIEQARLDKYTAPTAEKAKIAEQRLNDLLKKRRDIGKFNNHS